jgi:hypothetical protein
MAQVFQFITPLCLAVAIILYVSIAVFAAYEAAKNRMK